MGLQRRIIRCLADRYERLTRTRLNEKRQSASPRESVVATVAEPELDAALEDVRAGSGRELESRESGGRPDFCSVRSSCALAVSVFGPWRIEPDGLPLVGMNDFDTLRFEVKFPIVEDERRTPPNLDVVAWRSDHVVAVESKFVEHIAPRHTASFASAYDDAIVEAHPTWREKIDLLRSSPDEYRFFSAAQMVKHYLGLKADRANRITGRPVTLLYLYWEPADPQMHGFFSEHRAEVADFAEGLADEKIQFASLSYRELWKGWRTKGAPELRRHVGALEGRYLLDLDVCLETSTNVRAKTQ